MDSNPFESIVGRYRECQDDPPLPRTRCPSLSRIPGYNGPMFDPDSGEWSCPLCYSIVGRDNEESEELFDDDEDAAFANDEDYIAEGDRIQNQTDEQSIRVTRYRDIEIMVEIMNPINPKLARYLTINQHYIVDELRKLEEAQEILFESGPGKPTRPKILALAIHLSKIYPTDSEIRILSIRPATIIAKLKILKTLAVNDSELSPIVEQMYYVGKSVGISKVIIDIMVEQYEEIGGLPNKESHTPTRAAAWIYLKAKDSGIKGITKIKLKNIPTVKANALDRAIDSYKVNTQNRIKPVEGVTLIDDD